MLNRLTSNFSTLVLEPRGAVRVSQAVSPFQQALQGIPSDTLARQSREFNRLPPLPEFNAPFLQLTQAVDRGSLPITVPVLGLPSAPPLPRLTNRLEGWSIVQQGLSTWWHRVRKDLTALLPVSIASEPGRRFRTPPISDAGVPSSPMSLTTATIPVYLPQPDRPPVRQLTPELPRASAPSASLVLPPIVSSAQVATGSPLNTNLFASISAAPPPLPSPTINLASVPVGSSISADLPKTVAAALPILSSPTVDLARVPTDGPVRTTLSESIAHSTTQSTANHTQQAVIQSLTHPPLASPELPPTQPARQPHQTASFPGHSGSKASRSTSDSAASNDIHLHGGIHVQITAQTIDRNHAEETARAIAGHVLKEMNRITDRDRLRRGLPPNR